MKKSMLSVFLLFIFLTFLEAAPVLQSDADIVAENWSKHWSELRNSEINVRSSETIGTQLYLYHLDPAGFLLISADDNLEPILAYDFTTTASETKPDNFLSWLDVYQEECDYVRSHEIDDTRCNQLWSELLTDDLSRYQNTRNVSPMIWSQWGEGDDWNDACPDDPDGPGGNAYAGSHAVAMAMLMKYWNHPAQGEGQNSYYLPEYGAVEAVFDTTHYGWTHMPNSFSTNWTENLIFHCGVATFMDYSPTSSTTSINAVAQAMVDHFRYSSEMDLLARSDYDETVWEGMVRTELENGRPLLYQGEGTALHAHLLDGYQNTDFFHFNWGNEGQYNGYFQLSAITPSTANYTSNQKALFNVQPSLGPDTIDESFENDWNTFNWEFAGQSEWQIATDEHFYGIKSAKSGDINHNQTSEIFQSWNVLEDGPITFWCRVSSEDNGNNDYDRLEFWIDGVEADRWGGERDWEQMSYDITAGVHEFRWIYRKDGSLVSGQDCAWIDAIDFPDGATPLNAPQNFTASIVNDDSVLMTWEAPLIRNLLGYRIFRNNVEITTILNPNTLQFIDLNLPNGSYSYYARAVYDSGVSDPTITHVINIEVLYPPTALVASVSNFDDVLLAWNMPATQQARRTPINTRSLMGYRIYRDNTLIDSVNSQTTLQYADNDLPEGTHEYQVSAIYSSGYSELSNVAVAAIGVPWPPSELTAQVQNFNEVFLDWTAPPQTSETLTGYKIYRGLDLVHEMTDITSTSYTELDLPNGTHVYHVTAIYGEVESGPSNTAVATIEVPYPPQNLIADVAEDDVTLDWDAPATGSRNLTAYYVYRNNSPIATIWNTNVTSYFDPMLANGFYAYKVIAVYGDVYSEPSNIVNIEMDIPYPPSNLSAQIENLNDIVLNWDQPPVQGGLRSFLGYHVVRNGENHALVTDFNQLTWTDENVDNGVYEYFVYAEYNAGNSESTNDVEVTVEVLYPPQNPSYTIDDDDVVLTWDLPATGGGLTRDLLGYTIYRDDILIQTINDPAVLTWTDLNLANATYTYYLQATYTSGVSAPTDNLDVMVEVFYPASNLVGEIINEDDVALTWSPALNSGGLRMLQGYRVFRNDIAITDVTPADTTWLDSTLPNGDYIYYVKALYENGLSAETNHVPIHIEVMYPARQLTASVTGDDVNLAWLEPLTSGGLSRDLLGYRIYRDSDEIAVINDPAQVAFMDMNLDNGSYSYTVRAEYAVGLSEPSNTALASIEVLYPPTNLTAIVTNDTVSLNWNIPDNGPTRNLLGYTIIRNGSVLLQIADPATVGYEDTGLANGEYSYEVVADYSTGQSASEGPVTATVEVLYAPRNLGCSLENYYNAVLTWDPPLNQGGLTRVMNGYQVFRDSVLIADVTDVNYTDNALPDGSYDYTVKAVYTSGVSQASNTVNAIIEYPYAPSGLSAAVSQDTVSLVWTAPSSNTVLGYTIYRDGVSIADINDSAILNFNDTGLANGSYSYYVIARYNVDDSVPSNTVTATVEVLYPPQNLEASVMQDEVTLSWELPAVQGGLTRDLLGYKVYRDGNLIEEITGSLTYTDIDLANGAYDYEVSAVYTTGESQMSNLVTATVEVLYPPQNLTYAVTQDEVTLTWQLPAVQGGLTRDLLGYKVYRDGVLIEEVSGSLTYTDIDLANGAYDYEVSAVYTTGESQMSNLVTATVEVLYPPQNLEASVMQDEVTLTWQLPAVQGGLTRDLLGYKVYRDGVLIEEITGVLTYTDVNLANGAYDYEVSAVYTTGESQMSNLVTATVEVLYPPQNLVAEVAQDEVTLSWQLPAVQGGLTRDLLGYKVYRDGVEITETNDLNYLDIDLANGVYDYEVSAVYTTGESQMSNLVTATVEVLYPPQNLEASVMQDEVTLTWQLPAVQGGLTRDLLGYKVYRDGVEINETNDLNYLDIDLANGAYDYEVSAVYTTGESQMSNLVTATVEVLYPPQNLEASVMQDEVTLTWQLPAVQGGLTRDLLGYKVYRDGVLIEEITGSLTYTDIDLANGAYDYEVSAVYTTGESQMSNLVTATVEVLYPPQNLVAEVTQDEVTLSWQLPAVQGGLTRDLLGYKVYRDGVEINETNDLNYLDIDLANGAYDYEVSALYTNGESQMSNLVTATVEVLYPPQNLVAEVAQDEVTLTWQLPAVQGGLTRDLLGYKVYRNGILVEELIGVLTYIDVNLANGAYDYEVSAVYTTGESQMSNLVTATVEVLYPPRNLSAVVSNEVNAILSWDAPLTSGRSLNGYLVFRNGSLVATIGSPAQLTWTDYSLQNGGYDYSIQAFYTTGISPASNIAHVDIDYNPVLDAPSNLNATVVNGNDVELSWTGPESTQIGYKIYRDGAEIAELTDPTTVSFTDIGLPNGVYVYAVTAIYSEGESSPSNTAVADILITSPPQELVAQIQNDNEAALSWNPPVNSGYTGYVVYRNNVVIAVLEANTENYTDTGLANGDYDYYVKAQFNTNLSIASNTASVNVEILYPPTDLTADVVNSNDVTLTWAAPVTGRSLLGYNIYRDGVLIDEVTGALTYTDINLANGAYDYEVSALYTSGESQMSNLVTASIEVLYPPQNLEASVMQDEVTLTWQLPAVQGGLTRAFLGYNVYRDGAEIANINDPATLTYLDIDLANGAYDYEVSVLYTTGESQMSNLVTATVEVLYPPQNLTYAVMQDEVTLSWELPAVQGGLTRAFLGYKVYRDGAEIANINDPATLTYLDIDLANGAYDYEVSALYTTGESQMSNLVTATVEVLYPPTGLTATVTIDDVLLNWNIPQTQRRNRSLTGYQLYRNGSMIATIDNPAITTYTETDLVNGSYTYEVMATYSSGNSPLSEPAVAVIAVVTPPENPAFTILNGNDVDITWELPINQTTPNSYTIYRDGADVHTTENGTVLTWTDTDLENGDYNYWLTATYDAGESIATETMLVQIAVMNPPTGLSADVTLDMVELTWIEPANASGLLGFIVYRDSVEIAQINAPDVFVYDDFDLAAGDYQYFVTANYTVGESEPSNTIDATILLPPPGNVLATPDSSDVVVSWDTPAMRSLVGFRIYRDGAEIVTLDNPALVEYTDANLPNGDYSYTVQSLFTSDVSDQSTPAECTVEVLWAPENLEAELGDNVSVSLTWDAHPMGVTMTAYKVYRNDVEIAQIDDPEVTHYDDLELAPGYYTYTVTALYNSGESDPSNEVDIEIYATGDEPIPPMTTQLIGNAPNPFNPSTTIMFSVASDSAVNLSVFNVRGQKVATLVNNEVLSAGEHRVVWNAGNAGSGVYFVRMSTQKSQFIHKMLLVK